MIKFSIIIPVYNREKLISQTIESVIIQTYKNWECIIIDDNSNDSTIESIKNYVEQESRIKIFKSKRRASGAPSCRNIGIKKSTGTHIIFLDSDDILMPWALYERNLFIVNNTKNNFFLSQGLNFEKNGKLTLRGIPNKKDYIIQFITFQTAFQTTAPTWERNFLINIGGWNENLIRWQDPEIHIRALTKLDSVVWKSEIPDYAIRYDNKDKFKITDFKKAMKTYDNLILAYLTSLNILEKEHKFLFKKHILSQVWRFGEHLNYIQLKLVSKILLKNQIFNKKIYNRYFLTILLMIIFKKIPLLRKLIYLQIKKNTLNIKNYSEYKDLAVINEFKERVNQFENYSYLNNFKKILAIAT